MTNLTFELISQANAKEILEFEKENRDFFEAFVPSRGDEYYQPAIFQEIINSLIEEQLQDLCYMYVIRNQEGEMVGRINIVDIVQEKCRRAELGYRIGQKHGGKGYATAAVKLAINEAFERHRIEQLEAGTSPSNRGSQIVLIKNGFEFVRREGQAVQVGDRLEDSIWFVKKKAAD
ncbi:GNAT family N-acetyltransferase [Paenibacillus motobuensis]|uniref:GNAT family N-acetyltransferase n=1 Tax=Paenibacillus motobuensis TaxID=295324 RepID=A0ABP3ID32_9BACL